MKQTYEIIIVKQLQIPVGEWELVFDCAPDEPIIQDVIYFAVCDVLAFVCNSNTKAEDDCFYGVILPVTIGDEGDSLEPVLTQEWVTPKDQKIALRKKTSHNKGEK